MIIIPLSIIKIGDRQRKTPHTPQQILDLKESILARSNLQPPVVTIPADPSLDEATLIVGEGRYKAICKIAEEGRSYWANNTEIQPGYIGVLTLADWLSASDRFMAEFEENDIRSSLTWQDRNLALARYHEMRVAENPEQKRIDSGRELVERGISTSPTSASTMIAEATLVAAHLNDPAIAGARNHNEAHNLILKRQQERVDAAIARRRLSQYSAAERESPLQDLRCGDCKEELPRMDEGLIDLICTDPPYGISVGERGFRSRTLHHHNYEDDTKTSREILKLLLIEGFRITKPRANIFIFFDIRNFNFLLELSARCGWTPFPRPLIWGKSDSEGLAPWGSSGPRLTTEYLFYATKGQRGLISSPTDYIRVNRVPRNERTFGAEKPVELMSRLIEVSTIPGDLVLDPCMGSGSTMVACRDLKRRGIGIELNRDTYNTAMSNVFKETLDGQADPVR